jgi:serine/threonine protein kinase
MGRYNNKSIVYICDFGLCKKFRDQNGKHIPFKDGKSLIGTVRYASINSHLGYEQSRRDDLESLAYSLIYFSKGSLPWMGIKAKNKTEKYNKIFEKKLCSSFTSLCDKLPNEFINFVQYIKDLDFEDKPNYQYLKSLLGRMYDKNNFNYDVIFDFSDILIKKEKNEKESKIEPNLLPTNNEIKYKNEIKDYNEKCEKEKKEIKIEESKAGDKNIKK